MPQSVASAAEGDGAGGRAGGRRLGRWSLYFIAGADARSLARSYVQGRKPTTVEATAVLYWKVAYRNPATGKTPNARTCQSGVPCLLLLPEVVVPSAFRFAAPFLAVLGASSDLR